MNIKHEPRHGGQPLPPRPEARRFNQPEHYKPSPELWAAVQTALNLGLPLLLTGEPGSGKTDLAGHVAWYYGLGQPEIFEAQTSSTATELFYRYDALRHFQHAQTQKDPLDPAYVFNHFIQTQALGKAIESGQPMVVLLDEIDKAPRDLPNNVLAALEKLEFSVPETGDPKRFFFKVEKAENRPIIIMTSNSEKNLPDPFLRRVAYFHIEPPGEAELIEIMKNKLEGFDRLDALAVVQLFERFRGAEFGLLRKKPATAELLHWASALLKLEVDTARLTDPRSLSAKQKERLKISLSALAKTKEDLQNLKNALG